MLCHPCILLGPQCQARGAKPEVVPNKGEQNQKRLPHPCLLGVPKEGGNATSPVHSRGSPTKRNKIRGGYLTPAFSWGAAHCRVCLACFGVRACVLSFVLNFSGAQKRVEMLRHPCILGDPQRQARGAKSEVVPNKGEQNQKWLPHPCLLGGPKEGGNAM